MTSSGSPQVGQSHWVGNSFKCTVQGTVPSLFIQKCRTSHVCPLSGKDLRMCLLKSLRGCVSPLRQGLMLVAVHSFIITSEQKSFCQSLGFWPGILLSFIPTTLPSRIFYYKLAFLISILLTSKMPEGIITTIVSMRLSAPNQRIMKMKMCIKEFNLMPEGFCPLTSASGR